jgi:tetratricopeptide (TPR) repeat protein
MLDGTLHISGRTRTLSQYVALAVLFLLSVLSVRTFLGAYHYGRVPGILDDRSSEESVTVMDLSEEAVPVYQDVVRTLDRAKGSDPSRALYWTALSDIYTRLGSWSETMELLKTSISERAPLQKESYELAVVNIREAIRRQPTNPDNHLAYGHLSRETKNIDEARSEYAKAVNAYPQNSTLRYAVTMEYLAAGMHEDALKQAKELARIDDSYRMPETDKKQLAREQRTPAYLNRLSGSYLFKAFEVMWRTSNKDVNMLRKSVPDNDEARELVQFFLESKGIIDE